MPRRGPGGVPPSCPLDAGQREWTGAPERVRRSPGFFALPAVAQALLRACYDVSIDWTTTSVFDYTLPDDTPMRAELERDLYRALLTLAFHEDVEPLLREALETITV